jgi:hypothetical protein
LYPQAPQVFPRGLSDGIDVAFPILNMSNKCQINQQTSTWEFPTPEPKPTDGTLTEVRKGTQIPSNQMGIFN